MIPPLLTSFTLLFLSTTVVLSQDNLCTCSTPAPSTALAAAFASASFTTIAKYCNNTPLRPFATPNFANFDRVDLVLNLDTVYKGDCSLLRGTEVAAFSPPILMQPRRLAAAGVLDHRPGRARVLR